MQVTQKCWIRVEEKQEYVDGKLVPFLWYSTHELDMSSAGWAMVSKDPIEVTFEIPDEYDYYKGQLDALQTEKKAIMAEFQNRLNEIDRRISRHLALSAPTTENGMEILPAVGKDDTPF